MPCPIQLASKLCGLSQHVIRIWERRYNALSPSRTLTNRRMYCDEAVKRLKLLKVLTENGHRIGRVAGLCTRSWRSWPARCLRFRSRRTGRGCDGAGAVCGGLRGRLEEV
jgi:hypothetical protein